MTPRPLLLQSAAGLWRRLLREGGAASAEARGAARRRTHLQSAKLLDDAGAFLCEATIQDVSVHGLRLLLARDCRLPSRFGVHVDITGEVLTAAPAWRRGRVVGARVVSRAAWLLRPSERAALKGRYYDVPG